MIRPFEPVDLLLCDPFASLIERALGYAWSPDRRLLTARGGGSSGGSSASGRRHRRSALPDQRTIREAREIIRQTRRDIAAQQRNLAKQVAAEKRAAQRLARNELSDFSVL
jgi:ribosome-binding protein aMBF1 (putative translation factor)